LSTAYSAPFATALKTIAPNLIANSEFLPWSGTGTTNPGLSDYLALTHSAGLQPSSFGEGGYLSAEIFAKVVKGITGDITPASVTAAFQNMQPVADPLVGSPFAFGQGTAHQPNQSSQYVELKDGVWQPISTDWTSLKAGS
jgi:branched-chain amino acid transport system substrate-binding protein